MMHHLFHNLWQHTRALCFDSCEYVIVQYIDSNNDGIATCILAKGSEDTCHIHPRDIFRLAVRLGAHALVLAHTHPSGNASPSDADRVATKTLEQAARSLRIPLLGHIILTRDRWKIVESG